jgi:hypothetical protein
MIPTTELQEVAGWVLFFILGFGLCWIIRSVFPNL